MNVSGGSGSGLFAAALITDMSTYADTAYPVSGVQAVLFGRDIAFALILGIVAVAVVAVVCIPVTAAGKLMRERALINMIGIYDKDKAVEIPAIIFFAVTPGAQRDRIIVALVCAFTVQVAGLCSTVIDRILGIQTAVDAVVEDKVNGAVVAYYVSIVDELVGVFDFHSVAGPGFGRSFASPCLQACIIIAVRSLVKIVQPAGSGVAVGAEITVFAVRHHEINSCKRLQICGSIFDQRSVFVYNIVGAERYGGHREYQQESQ